MEPKDKVTTILNQVSELSESEKLVLYLKLPDVAEESSRDPPTQMSERSNLALSWIKTHYMEDREMFVPKQDVYEQYRQYCESAGNNPLSSGDFGKVMKLVFPHIHHRRLGQRGQSKYFYKGLKRKENVDTSSPTEVLSDMRTKLNLNLLALSCQLVCEWAMQLLGRPFVDIRNLSEYLVSKGLSCGKTAAKFSLLSGSTSPPKLFDRDRKSANSKHHERQVLLQRKLQHNELIREHKEKLKQQQKQLREQHSTIAGLGSPSLPPGACSVKGADAVTVLLAGIPGRKILPRPLSVQPYVQNATSGMGKKQHILSFTDERYLEKASGSPMSTVTSGGDATQLAQVFAADVTHVTEPPSLIDMRDSDPGRLPPKRCHSTSVVERQSSSLLLGLLELTEQTLDTSHRSADRTCGCEMEDDKRPGFSSPASYSFTPTDVHGMSAASSNAVSKGLSLSSLVNHFANAQRNIARMCESPGLRVSTDGLLMPQHPKRYGDDISPDRSSLTKRKCTTSLGVTKPASLLSSMGADISADSDILRSRPYSCPVSTDDFPLDSFGKEGKSLSHHLFAEVLDPRITGQLKPRDEAVLQAGAENSLRLDKKRKEDKKKTTISEQTKTSASLCHVVQKPTVINRPRQVLHPACSSSDLTRETTSVDAKQAAQESSSEKQSYNILNSLLSSDYDTMSDSLSSLRTLPASPLTSPLTSSFICTPTTALASNGSLSGSQLRLATNTSHMIESPSILSSLSSRSAFVPVTSHKSQAAHSNLREKEPVTKIPTLQKQLTELIPNNQDLLSPPVPAAPQSLTSLSDDCTQPVMKSATSDTLASTSCTSPKETSDTARDTASVTYSNCGTTTTSNSSSSSSSSSTLCRSGESMSSGCESVLTTPVPAAAPVSERSDGAAHSAVLVHNLPTSGFLVVSPVLQERSSLVECQTAVVSSDTCHTSHSFQAHTTSPITPTKRASRNRFTPIRPKLQGSTGTPSPQKLGAMPAPSPQKKDMRSVSTILKEQRMKCAQDLLLNMANNCQGHVKLQLPAELLGLSAGGKMKSADVCVTLRSPNSSVNISQPKNTQLVNSDLSRQLWPISSPTLHQKEITVVVEPVPESSIQSTLSPALSSCGSSSTHTLNPVVSSSLISSTPTQFLQSLQQPVSVQLITHNTVFPKPQFPLTTTAQAQSPQPAPVSLQSEGSGTKLIILPPSLPGLPSAQVVEPGPHTPIIIEDDRGNKYSVDHKSLSTVLPQNLQSFLDTNQVVDSVETPSDSQASYIGGTPCLVNVSEMNAHVIGPDSSGQTYLLVPNSEPLPTTTPTGFLYRQTSPAVTTTLTAAVSRSHVTAASGVIIQPPASSSSALLSELSQLASSGQTLLQHSSGVSAFHKCSSSNTHRKANIRKGSIETDSRKGSIETDSRKGSIETYSRKGSIATDSRKGSIETDSRKGSIATDSRKGSIATDSRKGSIETDSRKEIIETDSRKGNIKTDGIVKPRDSSSVAQTCDGTLQVPGVRKRKASSSQDNEHEDRKRLNALRNQKKNDEHDDDVFIVKIEDHLAAKETNESLDAESLAVKSQSLDCKCEEKHACVITAGTDDDSQAPLMDTETLLGMIEDSKSMTVKETIRALNELRARHLHNGSKSYVSADLHGCELRARPTAQASLRCQDVSLSFPAAAVNSTGMLSGPAAAVNSTGMLSGPAAAVNSTGMLSGPAAAANSTGMLSGPAAAVNSTGTLSGPAAAANSTGMLSGPAAAANSTGMLSGPAAAANSTGMLSGSKLNQRNIVVSRSQSARCNSVSPFKPGDSAPQETGCSTPGTMHKVDRTGRRQISLNLESLESDALLDTEPALDHRLVADIPDAKSTQSDQKTSIGVAVKSVKTKTLRLLSDKTSDNKIKPKQLRRDIRSFKETLLSDKKDLDKVFSSISKKETYSDFFSDRTNSQKNATKTLPTLVSDQRRSVSCVHDLLCGSRQTLRTHPSATADSKMPFSSSQKGFSLTDIHQSGDNKALEHTLPAQCLSVPPLGLLEVQVGADHSLKITGGCVQPLTEQKVADAAAGMSDSAENELPGDIADFITESMSAGDAYSCSAFTGNTLTALLADLVRNGQSDREQAQDGQNTTMWRSVSLPNNTITDPFLDCKNENRQQHHRLSSDSLAVPYFRSWSTASIGTNLNTEDERVQAVGSLHACEVPSNAVEANHFLSLTPEMGKFKDLSSDHSSQSADSCLPLPSGTFLSPVGPARLTRRSSVERSSSGERTLTKAPVETSVHKSPSAQSLPRIRTPTDKTQAKASGERSHAKTPVDKLLTMTSSSDKVSKRNTRDKSSCSSISCNDQAVTAAIQQSVKERDPHRQPVNRILAKSPAEKVLGNFVYESLFTSRPFDHVTHSTDGVKEDRSLNQTPVSDAGYSSVSQTPLSDVGYSSISPSPVMMSLSGLFAECGRQELNSPATIFMPMRSDSVLSVVNNSGRGGDGLEGLTLQMGSLEGSRSVVNLNRCMNRTAEGDEYDKAERERSLFSQDLIGPDSSQSHDVTDGPLVETNVTKGCAKRNIIRAPRSQIFRESSFSDVEQFMSVQLNCIPTPPHSPSNSPQHLADTSQSPLSFAVSSSQNLPPTHSHKSLVAAICSVSSHQGTQFSSVATISSHSTCLSSNNFQHITSGQGLTSSAGQQSPNAPPEYSRSPYGLSHPSSSPHQYNPHSCSSPHQYNPHSCSSPHQYNPHPSPPFTPSSQRCLASPRCPTPCSHRSLMSPRCATPCGDSNSAPNRFMPIQTSGILTAPLTAAQTYIQPIRPVVTLASVANQNSLDLSKPENFARQSVNKTFPRLTEGSILDLLRRDVSEHMSHQSTAASVDVTSSTDKLAVTNLSVDCEVPLYQRKLKTQQKVHEDHKSERSGHSGLILSLTGGIGSVSRQGMQTGWVTNIPDPASPTSVTRMGHGRSVTSHHPHPTRYPKSKSRRAHAETDQVKCRQSPEVSKPNKIGLFQSGDQTSKAGAEVVATNVVSVQSTCSDVGKCEFNLDSPSVVDVSNKEEKEQNRISLSKDTNKPLPKTYLKTSSQKENERFCSGNLNYPSSCSSEFQHSLQRTKYSDHSETAPREQTSVVQGNRVGSCGLSQLSLQRFGHDVSHVDTTKRSSLSAMLQAPPFTAGHILQAPPFTAGHILQVEGNMSGTDSVKHKSFHQISDLPTAHYSGTAPNIDLTKASFALSNLPAGVTPLSNLPDGVTPLSNLPAGVTPLSNLPAGVTPLLNLPAGVTPLSNLPAGVTPLSNLPADVTPLSESEMTSNFDLAKASMTLASLPAGLPHGPTALHSRSSTLPDVYFISRNTPNSRQTGDCVPGNQDELDETLSILKNLDSQYFQQEDSSSSSSTQESS